MALTCCSAAGACATAACAAAALLLSARSGLQRLAPLGTRLRATRERGAGSPAAALAVVKSGLDSTLILRKSIQRPVGTPGI